MNKDEQLRAAFRQVLYIADGVDFSEVQYGKTSDWDSVAHMQLVAEIENSFDVMFSSDEVIAMSSYTRGVEILKAHGVSFEA